MRTRYDVLEFFLRERASDVRMQANKWRPPETDAAHKRLADRINQARKIEAGR